MVPLEICEQQCVPMNCAKGIKKFLFVHCYISQKFTRSTTRPSDQICNVLLAVHQHGCRKISMTLLQVVYIHTPVRKC